jgi:hypothetical protein
MKTFEELNYYELLNIPLNASSLELRRAFRNATSIYKKDSLLTYSLFSDDEREEILQRIEAAYLTLTDENKRALYDELLRKGTCVPRIEEVKEFSVPDIDLSEKCKHNQNQTGTDSLRRKTLKPTNRHSAAREIPRGQRTIDEVPCDKVSTSSERPSGRRLLLKQKKTLSSLSKVWLGMGTLMFVALVCYAMFTYTKFAQNIYDRESHVARHSSPVEDRVVSDAPLAHKYKPKSAEEGEGYDREVRTSTEADQTSNSHPDSYVNLASIANIRSRPTTTSEVIQKIHRGKKLEAVESDGDWLKVKLQDGSFGWIYRSLVKRKQPVSN